MSSIHFAPSLPYHFIMFRMHHDTNIRSSSIRRFNQTTVGYDATKEEKVEALKKRQAEVEQRLREKS